MSKSWATDADDYRRSELAERVAHVIDAVRRRGDEAVYEYALRTDGWVADDFRLSAREIDACIDQVSTAALEEMRFAQDQLARFAEAQRASLQDVEIETLPGVRLGHRHIPLGSVGAYVPAGRDVPAAALTSVVAARAAGVERVAVCAPPHDGTLVAHVVAAMRLAGVDEIYALGGVHAVAALAFGTESIPRVDLIIGSGDTLLVEAQRQLLGKVGIEVFVGPPEILVVADETADPGQVAADLLAEAAHDPEARAVLVTTSPGLAARMPDEIERRLHALRRSGAAEAAWRRQGAIHLAASPDDVCAIVDRHAFEHVEILTADPQWYLERLRNYGALFLGAGAAAAGGEAALGVNHTAPTGRAARFSGGLSVGRFLKTVTTCDLRAARDEQAGDVHALPSLP
jgi:sulfopropanediol 3-dehydrogenase